MTQSAPVGEKEIGEIVNAIFTSFIHMDIHKAPPTGHLPPAGVFMSGIVYLTGAWEGSVALDISRDLASRAACAMLGLNPVHLGQRELEDVLAEIVNITGGNIKALLPHPSKLSIPAVGESPVLAHEAPNRPLVSQVWFESAGQPLVVTVLGRLVPMG
jgi:chemotaxis protein CheX